MEQNLATYWKPNSVNVFNICLFDSHFCPWWGSCMIRRCRSPRGSRGCGWWCGSGSPWSRTKRSRTGSTRPDLSSQAWTKLFIMAKTSNFQLKFSITVKNLSLIFLLYNIWLKLSRFQMFWVIFHNDLTCGAGPYGGPASIFAVYPRKAEPRFGVQSDILVYFCSSYVIKLRTASKKSLIVQGDHFQVVSNLALTPKQMLRFNISYSY